MHPTRHLATCTALAVAVGVLAACTPDDPGPTTSPSTASSTPSTTPASPSASPTTPKEVAFAAADATYRAWIQNYAEAWKTLDPALVNQDLVSDGLYAFAQTELTKFAQDPIVRSANFTIDVKSLTPTSYLPDGVAIRYCQVVDTRFIDKDGKDITRNPDGSPAPANTTYRSADVTFITTDGGTTWRVDRFSQSPTEGEPC